MPALRSLFKAGAGNDCYLGRLVPGRRFRHVQRNRATARVLTAKPERVYRAFLDADAMAKWLPPYGFTGNGPHLEAKVGGGYKMSFTNFSTATGIPSADLSRAGALSEDRLHGPLRRSEPAGRECSPRSRCKAVSAGTDLSVVQEGIPEAIPVEMCYLGWQQSLAQLATLVEPEIPD
jgi:hypothetical protein